MISSLKINITFINLSIIAESMQSFNVVLLGGELGKLLGKKGTESDITLYSRKHEDILYTFVEPHTYPEKLSSLLQSINMANAAVMNVSAISSEFGETIVALELLNIKQGLIITQNFPVEQLKKIIRGTVVEDYKIVEMDFNAIIDSLASFKPSNCGFPLVVIDHFFKVKSVGTVILGVVKGGEIKKYQKLRVLPGDREVLVKSIQIHDVDVQTAGAGDRVGLSLKGIDIEELDRGYLLTEENSPLIADKIMKLKFEKTPFFKGEIKKEQKFMLSLGLFYEACTIKNIKESGELIVETNKPVVYKSGDIAVLTRPELKGLRLIGKATVE